MAKLSATLTVVFFFVLAFSDAFSVRTRPENDVFVDDLTTKLPEHETEAVAGDGNGQPGSVPETIVEFESGTYGSGSGPEIPKTGSSSSEKEVTVPRAFMNFRPINRHFPKRPLAEFRFHRRPCRLHHHRFHHRHQPWGPRVEIPYGEDMILSSGEKETGSDPVVGGVSQQIPVTWVGTQEDVEKEREMVKKIMKKMHRRDHHYHDDDEKEEGDDEDEGDDDGGDHKEYKDWFMKKVRKFLKHQF